MVKNCKYMRTKYNYTPNDYDLSFDFQDIPSNISLDDVVSLNHTIAEVTPLGKKIHLNLNTTSREYEGYINVRTSLTVNGRSIKII